MGTNYYLHQKPDCECCGRPFEPLHIGKSSGGWCFSMHVMPEDGINTLEDWRRLWSQPGAFIRNEYGETISGDEMDRIITVREGAFGKRPVSSPLYESEFLEKNSAVRGPNGLLRHKRGDFCIGHGDGTFDYMVGEFS